MKNTMKKLLCYKKALYKEKTCSSKCGFKAQIPYAPYITEINFVFELFIAICESGWKNCEKRLFVT